MIDIREAGTEVFVQHNPRKFYAFCGEEYGVKLRYMSEIIKTHGGKSAVFESVRAVIVMLKADRLFPLEPCTYIIRYDQNFVKCLDDDSEYEIDSLDFDGTIIVLFEDEASLKRCEKWIPKYTVHFENVSPDFIQKYLASDYPSLLGQDYQLSVNIGHSYIGATMVAESLSNLDADYRSGDQRAVSYALSPRFFSNVAAFRNGVAARNFTFCVQIIDSSEGDLYPFIYGILSTMLEVEKILENPKSKSWCSKYAGNWNIYDAVTVFGNTYRVLKDSRTLLSYDLYAALLRVLGSMRFSPTLAV